MVFYFILLDGGDVEVDVDMFDVANSLNTASFGGTSDDGGFGLPVYDGDVGTLNDNYDFWWVAPLISWKLASNCIFWM